MPPQRRKPGGGGSGSATGGSATVRCAIYTRKSTEEGLEQAFNSLDAQREACAAYILSQRHEGWTLAPDLYDDGGFSGGTMDRPGLKHLLGQIEAGRIDVIIVYKVDRLTRSLADFAKIVEVLDARGASFVSVTQAFNTTTSMGRLTLNVLLSFAQFEREVTGERIRDKIAASKAKGMWMGGNVPFGYKVEARMLVVVEQDAVTLRYIFERYLALRSVIALTVELQAAGIVTQVRTGRSGKSLGGKPFSRGALYTMLQNRIYIGQVRHNETWYPGQHPGIVSVALFEQVQALLSANRVDRLHGTNAEDPSLLAGLVRDALGRRMSPAHAVKVTRRYRYYVSRNEDEPSEPAWRLPAAELEAVVLIRVAAELRAGDDDPHICAANGLLAFGSASQQREALLATVDAVTIHRDRIEVQLADGYATPDLAMLTIPAAIVRAGKQVRIATTPSTSDDAHPDPALIKLVVKAHMARQAVEDHQDRTLDAVADAAGYTRNYFGMLLRIGFLAPDITAAILDGRQPARLTRQRLARVGELPLAWDAQRALLGFSAAI